GKVSGNGTHLEATGKLAAVLKRGSPPFVRVKLALLNQELDELFNPRTGPASSRCEVERRERHGDALVLSSSVRTGEYERQRSALRVKLPMGDGRAGTSGLLLYADDTRLLQGGC